jgi:hypothetical protein
MAAGATYEPIATTTLGSTQASISFSSLGSYTDLILVCNPINTSAGSDIGMQFNSDTGNNYSGTWINGNGTSASSSRITSYSYIPVLQPISGQSTVYSGQAIIQIMNYRNSTTYKTVLSRYDDAAKSTGAEVGLWRNTAAITSVLMKPGTGSFAAGSTFTIYGIAAA